MKKIKNNRIWGFFMYHDDTSVLASASLSPAVTLLLLSLLNTTTKQAGKTTRRRSSLLALLTLLALLVGLQVTGVAGCRNCYCPVQVGKYSRDAGCIALVQLNKLDLDIRSNSHLLDVLNNLDNRFSIRLIVGTEHQNTELRKRLNRHLFLGSGYCTACAWRAKRGQSAIARSRRTQRGLVSYRDSRLRWAGLPLRGWYLVGNLVNGLRVVEL